MSFEHFRHVAKRHRLKLAIVDPEHRTKTCAADAHCVFEHRCEDPLQFARRTADHFEHLGGGGLLLKRFAQLVEQTRVLDGNDGLRGEGGQQIDLLWRETGGLPFGESELSQ
jgi:hypothetical protein